METKEDIENKENNKNDEFVHYQKINIFGETYTGKSSLISLMENYDSDIFQLDFNENEDSFCISSSLVEQIKEIEINDEKNLYFYVYETNIDRFESIRMNLETLLLQTECIILIWDNSSPKTFENIPPLISTIEDYFKQNTIKVPIFVIQNKMDLPFDGDAISITKDKFNESINKLKENSNITYKEITLKTNKNDFYKLIGDIENKLSENSSKNKNEIYNVKYHHPIVDIQKTIQNINYINCMLLGYQATGKTSFLHSIVGKPISNIISTVGMNHSTFICEVNGEKIYFQINDTAGQERFMSIPKAYYRGGQAFLVFFDVTNEESFKCIDAWINSILDNNGKINEKYELFLVANKIDENNIRKIGKTQGNEIAKKYGIKYYEISCLKKINIYELLYEITLMAYKKINKKKEKVKEGKGIVDLEKKQTKKKKPWC